MIFYYMKNLMKIFLFIKFHKKLIGAKPLHILFAKVDEFIRSYNETKYLELFASGKNNVNFNKIRYLIRVKSII